MGRGRTTTGMIVGCLIKEIQITTELRKMESIDLVSKPTVDDLIFQKFESPLPKSQDDDDPFIKGEFDVIKELLEKLPATVQGKNKLEWYRTVDAAKLEHLKEMMAADNYKENLGTLIRTIYDFAFVTYADLPRGAIKNNSMRRLAATTLMEILPPHIAERVNKKMEEDPAASHDFLSLVGLVSYYGSGEEHW